MAIATPSAGSPARIATGNKTAPNRATAGDGQKNQEITIMSNPIVQNPRVGFFIIFVNGAIITSFIPVFVNIRLIATIIEMMIIVDKSSVMAYIQLLKTPLIDEISSPVATMAMT